MQRAPLYLSYDAEQDWLKAFEFGTVSGGQPEDHWRGLTDDIGYLLAEPDGRELGFIIKNYSEFDPEDGELAELWEGPRYDAPALGLHDASAGEIAVAAAPFFDGESSINRQIFNLAAGARGEDAARLWRACLQAGDPMAHHGLGYTLFELGRHREAAGHLRAYAELAPGDPWAWCWLGRACHALGETAEAEAAYRRALEQSEAGAAETDAAALLKRLAAGESAELESDPGERVVWLAGIGADDGDGRQDAEQARAGVDVAARILERTRRYSTAGRHSDQPPASLLANREYDENQMLTCPMCGWSGKARRASLEYHRDLFDVSCPECEKMLLVVSS